MPVPSTNTSETPIRGIRMRPSGSPGLLRRLSARAANASRRLASSLLSARWSTAASGARSIAAAVIVSLFLACLAGLLVVLRVRHKVASAAEPERLRTRGPAGYAGPGSLGGTESALRR